MRYDCFIPADNLSKFIDCGGETSLDSGCVREFFKKYDARVFSGRIVWYVWFENEVGYTQFMLTYGEYIE